MGKPILSEDSAANRRKFPRVFSLNLVSIEQIDSWGNLSLNLIARTLDLSLGGIKLELTEPVPFLSAITIKIGLKDEIIKADGKVIHLRLGDDEKILCGVDFIDLSKKNERLIQEFLRYN